MKNLFRRTLSLLLILVMAASMLPVVYAQETAEPVSEPTVLTQEDYASADAIFAQIDKMEDAPATKNASEAQLADQAVAIVMASDSYVEGSLERNGNYFTWFTSEGVRCAYSPYMREKYENMQAPENPEPSGIYNEPKATKGGWPSGNQVYLIAPYYGIDDSFTDQYKNEAKSIATAIGDTDGYTLYSGTSVTVDKVAEAMSNGAVVIFDSHGTTDYDGKYICDDPDGYEVYDYVSQANYSYLCLTSKTGLTTEDYKDGATYFTDSDGYMCACINGAAIANHMTKNSPSGLLWMAICLGMATDTFSTTMRAKGVEVVYGYSQSVTFAGDYCFEETFWDNMIAGKTVAQSVSAMKSRWGEWDWSEAIAASYGYSGSGYSLSEARKYRSAFPIVVSDEDSHPGKRTANDSSYGADSQQTVNSTYTLYSQYNVTATSNNTAYGTVSVNGSTITATPATGYFAQSATVTSGSATVSQNGNTFQVSASSDCSVQINFAPKTAVTVSFSGATVASQNGYAGDSMSLPTAEAPEGYKFIGWMTSPLNADTTEKPSFLSGSFIPTGNTTLYALYSFVDENTSSGTGDYVKVTETPSDWSGEYLIVYEAGKLVFNGSLTSLATANTASITVNNGVISADEGDQYRFIIEPMSSGYSIKSASGMYISGTSGSNTVNANTTAVSNTIHLDASGNADIVSNTSHLRYNSSAKIFRYYKAASYASQADIALYVKDGAKGTTYYTTNPTKCEHTTTVNVAAVAATCTEGGYTAGVQCSNCDVFISGHEPVEALGHNWSNWTQFAAPTCTEAGTQTRTCGRCHTTEAQAITATGHSYNTVVTPPTATQQGYTTYTCSNCGDSYVGDYVEALGQTYTVSFSVPEGVTGIADMTCGKAGITLPSAGAPEGYTFVGWTTALTDDTETKPKTYVAGNNLTTNANVTLFALYSHVVGGSTGAREYTLVTNVSQLKAGAKIVIASNEKGFVAGNITSQYMSDVSAKFSSDKSKLTTLPSGAVELTLGGTAGAWTLSNSNGQLLGATGVKKLAWGSGSTKWSISISGSAATIQNATSNYGRFLYNVTSPRFTTYTSDANNNMLLPQIYMMSGSAGTTYYTTIGTSEPVVAAVYGANGKVDTYATLEEAIAACGQNQYVQLLDDVEADLALTEDLYIDLNGHILLGDITGSYTVYGMDSATNKYDMSEGAIVGSIDNVRTHVLTENAMTGEIYRYMAIETENGWTFNRYYVGITHITLDTASVGLGYKAALYGNELIFANVDAFSYTLSLDGGNTITRSLDRINANGVMSLIVRNYQIESYGETDLSAYVTVTLGGEQISSAAHTTNMRQVVEQINDNYSAFSAEKLAAVKELILANEVMSSWNVANLLAQVEMIETVNEIYALAANASMENVTLKGTITSIYTAYNETYGNITVIITIAGAEDKPIKCYRMEGQGAENLAVGDVITVTGTVTHYIHSSSGDSDFQFSAGCTFTK